MSELKNFWGDPTFQNGGFLAGRAAGKVILEIALIVATGGIEAGITLVKNAVKAGSKTLSVFAEITKEGLGRIKKGTALWYRCIILKKGCFVTGTPVAHGTFY